MWKHWRFGNVCSRMSAVGQSHLPHRDWTVTGARSSSQHQQQIGQMLGHIFIFILVVVQALCSEGLVLKRQTVSRLLRPVADQF